MKYDDFLLINEAKIDEFQVGDYVICDKDFRGITDAIGKLAIIEDIKDIVDTRYFTLKFQKPDKPENELRDSDWKPYFRYRSVDTIILSKNQVLRGLQKIDPAGIKDWKKGNLVKFAPTRNLSEILSGMKFKIKNNFIDVIYVDIVPEKNDIVSYVPISKYKTEILTGKWIGGLYEAPFRQTMKVSKLLKKLNPSLNEKQMENFVAQFKNSYNVIIKNAGERFQIVTGKDIRRWYLHTRYDTNASRGTLGGSCMRHQKSQRRFNIYCENPDKIAMAIYLNVKGDLLARALIWKLDNGDIYMDRIYYVDYDSLTMLDNYSIEKKMKSYQRQDQNKLNMEVTLTKDYGHPTDNPYMDTMKFFEKKTFVLKNDIASNRNNEDYYKFRDQYWIYTDHD